MQICYRCARQRTSSQNSKRKKQITEGEKLVGRYRTKDTKIGRKRESERKERERGKDKRGRREREEREVERERVRGKRGRFR